MVRSTLEGDDAGAVKSVRGAGKIVSSDLRAASDLIPLDLASAVVDGLEESGRFLPFELLGLRLATGPVRLEWPDGDSRKTSRGILMGLPTTWALLCVIHGYW
jgi:hypothetical protein